MKYIKSLIVFFMLHLAFYANSQSIILYNSLDEEISTFPFVRVQSISFEDRKINMDLLNKETYSVSLSNANKIVFQAASITTVDKDNQINGQIYLYPNPAINLLNIELPDNVLSNELLITVCNIDGRKIYEKKISYFNNLIRINISDWKSGIYLIYIYDGENLFTNKLIKR